MPWFILNFTKLIPIKDLSLLYHLLGDSTEHIKWYRILYQMQMLDDFKSTLCLVRILTHFSNPTRIEGIYFLQYVWKGFSLMP